MKKQFAFHAARMALLAGAVGLGACTTALLPPNLTPLVAPSKSVEQASRRLEEVTAGRRRAEADYAASELVCYAKFFVNNCLDAAKEKRRSLLVNLRAVEDEAQYYQRKAAVDARDIEVANAVKEFEASEARRAAEPAPAPQVATAPGAPPPKPSFAARRVKQEARMAAHDAQQAAKAPAREAAALALERRKAESAERIKNVEERKAAKAAKAAREGAQKQ